MPQLTCTLNDVRIGHAGRLFAEATFSDGHECRVSYQPGTVVVMKRMGDDLGGRTKWQPNPRASEARLRAVHDAAVPIYAAKLAEAEAAEAARQRESEARDAEANEYHLKCRAGAMLYDALVAVRDGVRDDSPELWQQVDAAIAAAEGEGRREYHVGTPTSPYLQDVFATSPEEAARRFAYGNRGKDGLTLRPGEVEVFAERQPYRHFRFQDDAKLADELDRLENRATTFGPERDAQIAAIRAIIAERAGDAA